MVVKRCYPKGTAVAVGMLQCDLEMTDFPEELDTKVHRAIDFGGVQIIVGIFPRDTKKSGLDRLCQKWGCRSSMPFHQQFAMGDDTVKTFPHYILVTKEAEDLFKHLPTPGEEIIN